MKKAVVLLGKAGSGKSTIGKEVAARLGWHYTSTGDLARKLIAGSWQEEGRMAPEHAMRVAFAADIFPHERVVVDGMPRKAEQVPFLRTMFDEIVYYEISISDGLAAVRLLDRGRSDDTGIAIAQRLKDYADRIIGIRDAIEVGTLDTILTMDGTYPADLIASHIITETKLSGEEF